MTSLGHPQIDADLYQAQKVLNLGEDLHTLITAIAGTDNYDHTLPVSYFVEMLAAERRRKDELEKDCVRLREHAANIHNRIRHELSTEIEAATDKAFKAMSAIGALRPARQPEPRT